MGGNVQCPVCTLFLLPGMDLSDHLETHPKEQVIKALVQLSLKSEVAEKETQDTPIKNSNLTSAESVNHSAPEDDRTSPLSEISGSGKRSNVALEIHQKSREIEDSLAIPSGSRSVLFNRQCGYTLENNSGSSNSSSSNFFGPPTSYYHHQQQQQQQQNHQQQTHQQVPPPTQPHHHNNPQHQNYYPFHNHPHGGGGGGGSSAVGQGPGQPSMRLFSYPSQPKPLQPPPAYGAAISQLRSQNSQNLLGNNNNIHRPHYSPVNYTPTPTSSSSSSIPSPTTTPARIPPPLPPPPLNQRYQTNFSQMETSFTDTSCDNNSMSPRRTTLTPPTRPPPHLYRSPITSAGQFLRQSSSPYSVMAGSPSVLRYAESPVTAHYLERENGDFIVQETPKHIVECVEKDDGEFSVIERLYHMPPSVVQINEDQEDDLSEQGSDSEEMKMLEDDRPSGTWSSERLTEQVQASQHRSHKKSGITVLSDVQLDLNEYLDLMGNIIASSKTAKTRTGIVKVEKLEEEDVKDELDDEICTDEENPSGENGRKPEGTSEDNIEHENILPCIPVPISTSLSTNSLTENSITAATTSVIRLAAHPSVRSNTPTFSKDLEEPMQTDSIEVHPTNNEEVLQISSNEVNVTKIEEAWPTWETDIKSSKTDEECLLPNTTASDIKEDITEASLETVSTKDCELIPTTSTQATESTKDFELMPTTSNQETESTKDFELMPTSTQEVIEELPSQFIDVPQLPLSEEEKRAKIEMLDSTEKPETTEGQTAQPIEVMPVKRGENLPTLAYQQSIKRPVKRAPKKLVIKPKSKVPITSQSSQPRTTTPTSIIMPKPMQIATPSTSAETIALEQHKEEILTEVAKPCQEDDLNSIKSENLQSSVAGSISAPLFADADEKLPTDDDVQPCTSIVFAPEEEDALLASAADNKPTADLTAFFDQCLKKEGEEVHPMHSIFGIEMGGEPETISNTLTPPPPPRFPSSSLFPKPLTTSEHLSASESALPDSSDLMNHNHDHHEPQQQQQQQQNNSAYVEYPFSFLYGGEANQQEENKHDVSPPMYCSEDFQRYSASTSGGNSASCTWYQSQSSENDFEIDGKGSYLDLDSCKRSVSFAAATEGSMPTADALNIRTDEKMPAKGEISEQESNCGVENSWSQPLYNEFPVRSPMPYHNFMTNHESWSHDHYFRPQDLSSSVETKNFALRLTEESPVLDTLPSTSKRKNKTIVKVPRKKSFQCAHCNTHFPLLKEKNAHLIKQHGYKRCNRRLIRDPPTSTVTTATMNTIDAGASLLLGLEPSALLPPPLAEEEDSKAGIVKMEQASQEQKDCEKELPSLTLATTVPPTSASLSRTKYDTLRARDNRLLITFNLNALNVKNEGEVHNHYAESKSSFCCFVCRRDFLTVKLFDEHLNEHPAECFTCHKKFTRWKNFIVHLKRHLGWKDFGCTFCEKKFVIRSALVEHMRMHTGQTPLKCKVCGKSFKRYSNLTQHRKRHGNKINRTKEYVCYCGEVLPSKARFIWHKETHDLKPKCCPYCRDRFVHANSLRRHIRLAHSDKFDYTEPMECPMCKQIYAKSSIRAHMATHSMDTQHECLICNKSFSTKWNLKIHNWVHANRTTKPFKCDQCVKAFVREVDYNNHMNSHKQIKPYTCEHCGCKFIRKYNYIRHRREHHGNKKFTCDLCGKLFHRHYYLIEHRRIHTGERPFQCTICGKSSTTKTNHNKHLKIHHSRDPFTSEA